MTVMTSWCMIVKEMPNEMNSFVVSLCGRTATFMFVFVSAAELLLLKPVAAGCSLRLVWSLSVDRTPSMSVLIAFAEYHIKWNIKLNTIGSCHALVDD
mmetsp:Transcript_21988/g.36028  ORF Transcript_21988/g.36028 Transcript_21988/m.36028 type:complete len:98 (+) Transcript_21988:646-939(+)